jgi:hypothetical protein
VKPIIEEIRLAKFFIDISEPVPTFIGSSESYSVTQIRIALARSEECINSRKGEPVPKNVTSGKSFSIACLILFYKH